MTKPITVRISTSGTTTPRSKSCVLKGLMISSNNAGTTWTLKIQDKAGSPNVLIPEFTIAVPTDGNPNVYLMWDKLPVPMDGGIDIITAGTPGVVTVWLWIEQGSS